MEKKMTRNQLVRALKEAADPVKAAQAAGYFKTGKGEYDEGYVNNWDLVDASSRPILGEHLKTHPRGILKKRAKSKSLWERRIAMVSTMTLVWPVNWTLLFRLPKYFFMIRTI